jgi:hypothetical protein
VHVFDDVIVFVFVQVFERVSSLVKVDPSQGHRPLAGFSVTIADCGAMPASYRSPVHGAALRSELAAVPAVGTSSVQASPLAERTLRFVSSGEASLSRSDVVRGRC